MYFGNRGLDHDYSTPAPFRLSSNLLGRSDSSEGGKKSTRDAPGRSQTNLCFSRFSAQLYHVIIKHRGAVLRPVLLIEEKTHHQKNERSARAVLTYVWVYRVRGDWYATHMEYMFLISFHFDSVHGGLFGKETREMMCRIGVSMGVSVSRGATLDIFPDSSLLVLL